mmetsp:Transcript_3626/g.5026  ORF Transcript_3626/g.5026 Transcript_3626/m.5026 type:complete len:120 (-) Transcript_3626:1710-2069(-)
MNAECYACKNQISGQGVQAVGKTWHKECFVCDFCKKPFTASFVSKYDRAYCKPCDLRLFGNYCKGCNKPIEGQSLVALNSYWHPEHFACAKCGSAFSGGSFAEKNGRPFCPSCFASVPS